VDSRTTSLLFPLSNSICILTDNTVQLPQGVFPGLRLIKTLPLRADEHSVSPPSLEDFLRAYRELEHEFAAILVLTISSHLLPVAQVAKQAALQHGGKAQITALDSKQTGPGLGMLAQLGAQAILAGESLIGVEGRIRAAMAHIYTLIHLDAEDLSRSTLTPAQTNAEEPGPFPLFMLEDGQLAPYKKIRTRRHLLESFQEFVEEFETPRQITFLRGRHSSIHSRPLREIARERFPKTPFSDMEIPAPLARVLGSQAAGVTVMEMPGP
jgi:fatty acid-binding protein DegV